MSSNKFVGIAYWSVENADRLWLSRAVETLSPLEAAGLATVLYDCLPAGDQMTVVFGNDNHQMLIAGGKGRGVVRASESATSFLVCLVAIRKALGCISVVTESQETVPTLPRQAHPLFSDNWPCVQLVAQELGLATGAAFMARHANVLNTIF